MNQTKQGQTGQTDLYPDGNHYKKEKMNRIYAFPADPLAAEVHKQAIKFGYNSPLMKDGTVAPICPCCENLVNTVPLPLCADTSPISFCGGADVGAGQSVFALSPGASLYFTFVKMCVYFLLLRFLVSDLYNLWTSGQGHYCERNPRQCSGDFYSFLSGYNKHTEQDVHLVDTLGLLNIALTVLSVVFFYFCRKYQYRLYAFLKRSETTQDQFTVLLQNIPLVVNQRDSRQKTRFDYEQILKKQASRQIQRWVEKIRKQQVHEEDDYLDKKMKQFIKDKKDIQKEPIVSTISICYDLKQMEQISDQRQKLMEEYMEKIQEKEDKKDQINGFHQKSKDQSVLTQIPGQIKILNEKYIELSKQFVPNKSSEFKASHFIEKAFVTFRFQHYRAYFLRQAERDPDFFKLNEKPLQIEKAGKPNDIFWSNLKVSNWQRRSKGCISFLLLALVAIVSFVLLLAIDQGQGYFVRNVRREQKNEVTQANQGKRYLPEQAVSYIFAILFPVMIVFINYLATFLIDYLAKFQRHKSKTEYASSFVVKYVILRFFNTAIVYLTISLIHQNTGPLTQEGIVLKVLGLIGFTGVILILVQIIEASPSAFCEWFPFLSCCSQEDEDDKKLDLFQIQLNKETELSQFDLAEQYCRFLFQLLVVSFYATLVPLGVGLLIVLFIIKYWVSKRTLFNWSSYSQDYDFYLARLALKIFEWSLFVFAVGNLVFGSKIHVQEDREYIVMSWIIVVIAGVYVGIMSLIPQSLERSWFSQEEMYHQKPYEYFVAKNSFKRTYWMQNPATAFLEESSLGNNHTQNANYLQIIKKQDYKRFMQPINQEEIMHETYTKEDVDYFIRIGLIKN